MSAATVSPLRRVSLLPHHANSLVGIDEEIVAERGYYSLHRGSDTTDVPMNLARLKALGIPKAGRDTPSRLPGLVIPQYRPTGEHVGVVYRPDNPPRDPLSGKQRKYLMPAGRPAVLDVHPRNAEYMTDPTVELWITEGTKKADALLSNGLVTAALAGVFNWRSRHGTLGDWEDVQLRGRSVVICFDSDATSNPNVLRAMIRFGRWLKSKGAKPRYCITPASVHGVSTKGVDDYLAAGGTISGLRDAVIGKEPVIASGDDRFSDARMAEVIADEVLAERFVYTREYGWREWDGTRWVDSSDTRVIEEVRQYVLAQFGDCVEAHRGGNGTVDLVDGWRGMLSANRIKTAVAMAAGIVLVVGTVFDRDHDLLNTPSGIVDLRTGDLGPHDPEKYMTKVTSAAYIPGATHPAWDRALEAIPADVHPFYQAFCGQAITGWTMTEDWLLIAHGGGENGKGVINNDGIKRAVGDYALSLSDRVLLSNPSDHPTELMTLQGVRLALLDETPEARTLDTQRLKRVIGQPTITSRRMYKDPVEFDCTHTLLINTNHLPVVNEVDDGSWRRLLSLQFPYRFVKPGQPLERENDRHGDPAIKAQLRTPEGQAAILAWLIEGSVAWYENDRRMPAVPDRILADTAAWRGKTDQLMAYLEDRLVPAPASHIVSTDLLADLNDWLKDQGHKPWAANKLKDRLEQHPLFKQHRMAFARVRRNPADPASTRPDRAESSWVPVVPRQAAAQYTALKGVRFRDPDE
jgi:putative DNA primase/helicase